MMNYSDEIINAYVDGELDGPEKEKLKQDIKNNKELAHKVHSLCALKKSIQSSYNQIPFPEPMTEEHSDSYQANLKLAAFAVLVLCVGFFLGSNFKLAQIGNDYVQQEELKGIKLMPIDFKKSNKIILHVSSSDPKVLYNALYKINMILEKYNENKIPFELEVMANAGGIDLFRKDVSPYKDRIQQIMKNYKNVSFIACSNAIERLRLKGIEPELIAETRIGVTAIEQIVKRLQEGWVYLKV